MSRLKHQAKRLHSSTAYFHKHILIYLVIFALVGGAILYRSFAANPNLPGDVNNDNAVNITDLSILLSNYSTNYPAADFNSDSTVNILDLSILLTNYNRAYTPTDFDQANIWIDLDGGACTRSSTASTYSTLNACGSFDAAYQVAQQGDIVRAQPGTYPGQTINYSGSKDNFTSRVIFELDGVSSSSLTSLGAQHIEIKNLTLTDISLTLRPSTGSSWYAYSKPTKDWVYSGGSMKVFLIRNATDVTIKNTSVGGYNVDSGYGSPKIGEYEPSDGSAFKPAQNITLQNILFHDVIRTSTASSHAECLYLDNGIDGLKISGSTFTNCGVMDVHADLGIAPVANVLIENNFFDIPRTTDGGIQGTTFGLKGSAGLNNWVVRYNTIVGNFWSDAGNVWNNPNIYSNLFAFHTGCAPAIPPSAYGKNMMDAVTCGASDVIASPSLVSVSTATCQLTSCYRNDLHLLASSPAINAATGISPSSDIDGQSRPNGPMADLGADEKY